MKNKLYLNFILTVIAILMAVDLSIKIFPINTSKERFFTNSELDNSSTSKLINFEANRQRVIISGYDFRGCGLTQDQICPIPVRCVNCK